mgnify:CR=1 FL=1
MITVIIYGLDQFVVGRLSREMTPGLAKLYETSEDNINFVAPETMVFHKGTEQTSWNVLIHVHAPMKVSVLQDLVKTFIFKSIGEMAIHKTIEFYYVSQDNRYEDINENYPRYLAEDNLVDIDEEDYRDKEEGDGEDEIYTGDIFEEAGQDECECGHDHCECDDDDCGCGHHHHN